MDDMVDHFATELYNIIMAPDDEPGDAFILDSERPSTESQATEVHLRVPGKNKRELSLSLDRIPHRKWQLVLGLNLILLHSSRLLLILFSSSIGPMYYYSLY
jgi:hypothetical protein